ncbi:MAG: cell wall metabolism sensor histidine kinase WalK [Defluviitaleaceae bacterium]|nr:cell wall metabolism sensor histidine kinase WalK [Defluviitaleaceae bacterium]
MSIRWKLVIVSVALVFLVILATGTFIVYALRASAADDAARELSVAARHVRFNVIDDSVRAVGEDFELETAHGRYEFEGFFDEPFYAVSLDGMEAFIIRARPYPHQVVPLLTQGSVFNRAVTGALTGQSTFLAFREYPDLHGNDASWFMYAYPVFLRGDEAPDYVVFVRMSAEDFEMQMAVTAGILLFGGAVALGVAILFGIAFSVPLTKNLLFLNQEILEYKIGSEPIVLKGSKDEVLELAEGFNTISKELSDSMDILTNEKNKVEIVMYNMTDGVLAYSARGVLIHSNHACEQLLGVSNLREYSMNELFKLLDVELIAVEELDNMPDSIIRRGDKYVNASFNTYRDDVGVVQGVVIVFQDITKHMHLDNMRKEFVANVSHELRTPLTTIKSYTETLLEGAGDDPNFRQQFLETINAESDRMTDIIRDLLELSRFDDNRLEFNLEPDDLVALVTANVQNHKITAEKQQKELTLISEIRRADVLMDTSRINQVINNIISNSIRYSHEGAKIQVLIQDRAKFYIIYIQDDGIGIPKEELRNIFERFYRVDKNRSRELGGTGLGLSIAKEIMEAHGGRIHATSELGVGTTMTLRFPKMEDGLDER